MIKVNKNFADYYKNKVKTVFGKAVLSTTNGISIYTEYNGNKIRFSDHSTGAARRQEEIQLGLNSICLDTVKMLTTKEKDIKKVVIKIMLNTEYGFNKIANSKKIISKKFEKLSKKGQELFRFTYECYILVK